MTEPVGMKKWLGKIVIMTLRNAELLQFSKSVEDNADAWLKEEGQLDPRTYYIEFLKYS